MISKHTPKPWIAVEAGHSVMVYGPNNERICKVIDNIHDGNIIKVAPDLLNLVDSFVGLERSNLPGVYFKKQLAAILKKADIVTAMARGKEEGL